MARRVVVVLGQLAAEDLREARDHYLGIDPELASRLRDDIGQVVERLELFPRSGRPVVAVAGVRRARLQHVPYNVFYRVADPDEVTILRVLHVRRDADSALTDVE